MLAHCSVLHQARAARLVRAFGHRLMMDRVVPGGVAQDIPAEAIAPSVKAAGGQGAPAPSPALVRLYDEDRLASGTAR